MVYLRRAIETSIQSGQYFDYRGIRIAFYRWNVEENRKMSAMRIHECSWQ